MSVATVLLADDDALVRDGLQVLIGLEPDLQVCASAGDGQRALECARQHRPDIALLDIRMPEMDGIECCRAIKQELPDTRILILTTFHDDELIHHAMQAGADGYLLKHQPSAVMIDGIRAVLIVGKVIRERNCETAIKGKNSRKRSTDRGSQAHNRAEGRYLSGQTNR